MVARRSAALYFMGNVFGGALRNVSFRAANQVALWSVPPATPMFSTSSSSPSSSSGAEALQRIYDTLMSISDSVGQVAAHPRSSAQIQRVMDAMAEVQLSDLGLTEAYLRREKDCVCMNVVCTDAFHVTVFIMPRGKGLPLHDHPGMTVLSKLVAGSLAVRSFSPDAGSSGSGSGSESDRKADGEVAFSVQPQPRAAAILTHAGVRTTADAAWLLTPFHDNVHEFTVDADATLPAVVLDVLLPPYVEPERPCNYYKAVKDPTVAAGEQGWWLAKASDPDDALLPYTVRYNGFKPVLQKKRKREK